MTVKEELHRLVDELSEDDLLHVKEFITELQADTDSQPLDEATLASLERGLADIAAGRVLSVNEFRRKFSV